MRKIIQIAFEYEYEHGVDNYSKLYALCDDGTMWIRYDSKWDLYIPDDMPQDSMESLLEGREHA
jgi:hypothetical protein